MASYIKSICELYLTFTGAEWDAQGDGISRFCSPSCPPGTALYVWTSSVTELREVKSRRSREIAESDDEEAGEEEKKGEGGGRRRRLRRCRAGACA